MIVPVKFIRFAVILPNLILLTTCQTWTSWSTCESIPNCFRRRVLTCDNGEGIQCVRDELYEQRAVLLSMNGCDEVCTDNNSFRKNITKLFQPCQGLCYDSTKIISYTCQSYLGCQLLDYYRCYVEQTCTGVWIPIETFTPCSATCGGGTQTAVAVCKNITTGETSSYCNRTEYGQITRAKVVKACNKQACFQLQFERIISSSMKKWVLQKTGNDKPSTRMRREECIPDPCNSWGSWAPSNQCNALCGEGSQKIKRSCSCGVGTQTRNEPCNTQSCPYTWSPWSESIPCNASCGGGTRQLVSACNDEDGSAVALCDNSGSLNRTSNESCNSQSCYTWSSWSIGSDCTVSCGNGTQLLTSNCEYNSMLMPSCDDSGESKRTRITSCNTQSCPTWSAWSKSSPCSVTCDGGMQQFLSTCIYNGNITMICNDNNGSSNRIKEEPCNPQSCPTWSSWSESSPCSSTCGGGTRILSSTCSSASCDESSLPTRTKEEGCNNLSCPIGSSSVPIIAGAGGGGAALLLIILLVVVFIKRRKKKYSTAGEISSKNDAVEENNSTNLHQNQAYYDEDNYGYYAAMDAETKAQSSNEKPDESFEVEECYAQVDKTAKKPKKKNNTPKPGYKATALNNEESASVDNFTSSNDAILDNAYNVPDYHNTQHAGEKQDFTQSDSSVQETYAAIDPTALASKKQKKAKVKTANRKNRQAQQKTTTCHAENQNSMPDQEEAYQVLNTDLTIDSTYDKLDHRHLSAQGNAGLSDGVYVQENEYAGMEEL